MHSFVFRTCLATATIGFVAGCASNQVVQVPPTNPVVTVVTASTPQAITIVETQQPVATVIKPAPEGPLSAASSAPAAGRNYQPETGLYRCEEKQTVAVKRVIDDGKKIVINWKAKDYDLALIPTVSGAVRYEDKVAGFAWIYVVGKAFLLDSKRGNRIANECKI